MTPEDKIGAGTATSPDTTQTSKRSARGILCAKCEHVNAAGSTKCSRCASHLHIKCNDCGVVNERILTKCKSCGRTLRKNFLQKLGGPFAGVTRFKPVHLLVFMVVVLGIFYGVVLLTELRLPPQN